VIADATFLRRADRARLAGVATDRGCRHVFIECRAPENVVRARLDARRYSVSESDARWETYLGQRREREPFGPDEPHMVLETEIDLDAIRRQVLERLWCWYQDENCG
jgi:predicted kinase